MFKGNGNRLGGSGHNGYRLGTASFIDHAMKTPTDITPDIYMQLTEEQKQAVELFNKRHNIFLSGPAGTGKTHTLKAIMKIVEHRYMQLVVTASTGIAAVLLGGSTLHSFAGIGLGQNTVAQIVRNVRPDVIKRWKDTDVLIIDEISMLSADYFVKLDAVVRLFRRSERPFGGIQLIISGDFLQLPPIDSDFVFQTDTWKRCNFNCVQFSKSMRQSNQDFYRTLGKIRMGHVTDEVMRIIGQCIRPPSNTRSIKPTKLYPTRDSVIRINVEELKRLNVEHRIYHADVTESPNRGIIQDQHYMKKVWSQVQCMQNLPLAVGAQVMLTKNLDVVGGLANGSRGVVLDMNDTSIKVEFIHGVVTIVKELFEVQITPMSTINIFQFPLLLAWATTIHKSQGLSLDLVEMDLSQSFEFGMIYAFLESCKVIGWSLYY